MAQHQMTGTGKALIKRTFSVVSGGVYASDSNRTFTQDVTSIPNYGDLTADNFVTRLSTSVHDGDSNISDVITDSMKSLTYNAASGIVTIVLDTTVVGYASYNLKLSLWLYSYTFE